MTLKHRLNSTGARSGTVVATLGAAAAGQLGLVLSGVIAARVLGVSDRGQLALIVLLPVVACQLISLGVPLAVTYQLAARSASLRSVLLVLKTTLVAQLTLAVGISGLLLWAFFRDERDTLQIAAAISVLSAGGMFILMYGLAILQGQRRFTAFNVWRTIPSAAYAAGALLILAVESKGVIAFSVVWSGAILMAATGTVVAIRRGARSDQNPSESAGALRRFGAKAFLGADSLLESFRVDQIIVALVLAPAALGLYVTAVAITNLPRFVGQSIGMVAYPSIAGARVSQSRAIGGALRWTALSGGLTLVIVAATEVLADDLIELFFGPEFLPAVDVLRILLVAAFFLGLRRVLGDGLRGANLPGAGSVGELVMWFVFLPAAVVLASSEGLEGVAIAMVLSSFVSLAAVLSIAARARHKDKQSSAPGDAGAGGLETPISVE